jgi:hypothetical protein
VNLLAFDTLLAVIFGPQACPCGLGILFFLFLAYYYYYYHKLVLRHITLPAIVQELIDNCNLFALASNLFIHSNKTAMPQDMHGILNRPHFGQVYKIKMVNFIIPYMEKASRTANVTSQKS